MYLMAFGPGPPLGLTVWEAEFRVDGFPVGWYHQCNWSSDVSTFQGDPLAGGCRIRFTNWMPCPRVLLCTVNYLAATMVTNNYLTVMQHAIPSNPDFQCPTVTMAEYCDPDCKVCVHGGVGVINGREPCAWPVTPTTWSEVKELYK